MIWEPFFMIVRTGRSSFKGLGSRDQVGWILVFLEAALAADLITASKSLHIHPMADQQLM